MSDFEKCLASAQRSLAMREHSSFQIKNKLVSKGFDLDIIESVILEIKNNGFQSDKRYTEEYITYRQNSGYGSKKIIYELKSNGISSELINDSIRNFNDDYDVLFKLAKTRIIDIDFDDDKKLAKYANNFRSRGFDNNIILKVINKIKNYEE